MQVKSIDQLTIKKLKSDITYTFLVFIIIYENFSICIASVFLGNPVSGQDNKTIEQIKEQKAGIAVWGIGQWKWIIRSGKIL